MTSHGSKLGRGDGIYKRGEEAPPTTEKGRPLEIKVGREVFRLEGKAF